MEEEQEGELTKQARSERMARDIALTQWIAELEAKNAEAKIEEELLLRPHGMRPRPSSAIPATFRF